ncbi:MAG: ATP-dependent Clp protease ATP-binding subunit [Alphaproteobacteria bacterium]|nr:ATP-dependent Clp protease ATP-binding subunit [Alphaproteobacteria bacterium]
MPEIITDIVKSNPPAVLARDAEAARLVSVLLRSMKNNAIILGTSGVGKTALIEGIAHLIAAKKVPPALQEKKLLQIDLSAIIAASASENDVANNFRLAVDVVLKTPNSILAVTDPTQLTPKFAAFIRPHVIAGKLRLIAESQMPSYKSNIEPDTTLMRRIQPITLTEPTPEETVGIVKAKIARLTDFHRVQIGDASISDAVKMAGRYIRGQYFPERAFALLDDACVLAVTEGSAEVTPAHLARTIALLTGVPVESVTANEKARLNDMENLLRKRVIGQDEAVKAVSEAMRRARSGLQDPNRPIGTFFFIGSTGVGKTELAKALAEFMFDDEKSIMRLDMSEYMEKSAIANIIGPAPGTPGFEQGGLLTESVRLKPYQVLLFDELEKAHPEILNILLQVLDEGRLTDSRGVLVDFRNTLIILTSNLAHDVPSYKRVEALSKYLRPEFINRIDDIISFNGLQIQNILQVVDIHLGKTIKRAKELGITLKFTDDAKKWFGDEIMMTKMGVRALKRLILHEVENPLANLIMRDKLPESGVVKFRSNPDDIQHLIMEI